MISDLIPLRFFAIGSSRDPGIYYAHQIDEWSELWCYGEHPSYEWAYVFRASLDAATPSSLWSGEFFGVPKGLRCDTGQLALRTSVAFGPRRVLERLDGTEGHEAAWLTGSTPAHARPVQEQRPGFQGEGAFNLSGFWRGDDGGAYYVNEVPGSSQIAWYGENPQARPDDEGDERGGARWANLMIGQRSGTTITGRWADVPRGAVDQHGEIELELIGDSRLEIRRVTGGFGGRRLDRVVAPSEASDIECEIVWDDVDVIERSERWGGGDDVSLHLAVARLDGSTVDLRDIEESSSDVWVHDTGTVARNRRGRNPPTSLSSVPRYRSALVPVAGAAADRAETVLGIAVAGIEQDKVDVTYADQWGEGMASRLDRRLRRGDPLGFFEVAGIRRLRARPLRRADDYLGYDAVALSWSELMEAASSGPRELVFTIRGDGGHWQVRATLHVRRVDAQCSMARRA